MHLIVLIVWLAIRNQTRKAEFIVLLLSFFIMIVLAVISDDGSLSKMARFIALSRTDRCLSSGPFVRGCFMRGANSCTRRR